MDNQEQRQAVIKEAREWIRTPYHSNARLKGIGCDCLTILSGVWENVSLIERAEIPNYSPQFMLNRSDELYMTGLLKYTKEVDGPAPGRIALWKFGRCFSHAAIVIDWPLVIHAYVNCSVQEEDVSKCDWLMKMKDGSPRPLKFFDFWEGR